MFERAPVTVHTHVREAVRASLNNLSIKTPKLAFRLEFKPNAKEFLPLACARTRAHP